MEINYGSLDAAYNLALTAPFPQAAVRHLIKRITDAGPPKSKEDSDKLAEFLKKVL